MPYMTSKNTCKKCGESNKLFRSKWHSNNKKFYLQSTCKECEALTTKRHQQDNKEKWRAYNRKAHLKKVGGTLSRRSSLEMTEALRKEYSRTKATNRCTRAKQARVLWDKELTDFVYKEAHELRRLRNSLLNFEWHVDHIIPLKGANVCGLHVWNNFAVIPKVNNLRKGNYHPVHD